MRIKLNLLRGKSVNHGCKLRIDDLIVWLFSLANLRLDFLAFTVEFLIIQ